MSTIEKTGIDPGFKLAHLHFAAHTLFGCLRAAIKMKTLLITLGFCSIFPTFCIAEAPQPLNGKLLWEQRCGICHTINPPPKIGPPVRGIVMHYRVQYTTKEKFSEAVSSWVQHPQAKDSLIPQAIQKFGLMPPLAFDKKELQEIAGWMWDEIP